jgi:Domain of unknown function (DUF6702)
MKTLFLILFLSASYNGFSHKFYISIADMEYDSTLNRITVSLKLIAHDFELMLKRKFGEEIDIETIADSSKEDNYIRQYLAHNFQLYSGDKQMKMSYLGKELNLRDDLFFFFYFPNIIDFTTIKIVNRLLFSISDQQQNIVHYKYLNRMKRVTLIPSESQAWITLYEEKDE